jgi:XrtN system VIT domain protein
MDTAINLIKANRTSARNRLYVAGIICIPISLLIFCIPLFNPQFGREPFGLFLLNYLLAIIFFVLLMANDRKDLQARALFLILFLISAYSLNRSIPIFEESVPWFSILLIVSCANLASITFFEKFPTWAKHIHSALLGLSFIAFLYLSLYLIPVYILSVVAAIALGLSLHSFVPLLFCFLIIRLMKNLTTESKRYWISFGIGSGIATGFAIVFIIIWGHFVNSINKSFRYSSITENYKLPAWVTVAQQTPRNYFGEKIMKTDLVYSNPVTGGDDLLWRFPQRDFDEAKKHDPLIMAASFFSGKLYVPEDDRIKILESMFDSRHQAQERLWTGEDLITEQVAGDITLWPKLRMSYTELDITVSNLPKKANWNTRQEAIYTFHLPEGGVVTSLSLWIEGREEKAILTTKAKADSAYKTIVGRESRDPSVLHWQEGNTVSVRVFPVLQGESRKFKIGITAPLSLRKNDLCYENIYFDGPSAKTATQNINIHSGDKEYNKTGNYEADWCLSVPNESMSNETFSFDGATYSILPYQKERTPFDPTTIYLDINSTWTPEEFERIYSIVKEKKIYVPGGRRMTEGNKNLLYDELRKNEFSLFPFYEIEDDCSSMVISKSGAASASIDDLKQTEFMSKTSQYFAAGHHIRLFNFGTELSPYLKSLKEFRTLLYEQGDLDDFQKLLSSKSFTTTNENDNQVVIDNAQVAIRRSPGTQASKAPDHLMRLFAYNHILEQFGNNLLSGSVDRPDLVKEAQTAYVVSPVSSLVVLETAEDYKRFDITSSVNSLQNASAKSKGAVPEPHEWALIIVVLIVIALLKFRFA